MSEHTDNQHGGVIKPIVVTDETFEETVLQSELPVVVDFWASWCGPCKAIAPSLDSLAPEFQGKLVIAKVDVDNNQRWLRQYGVRGIPALLYFHNGRLVKQSAGALPKVKLQAEFEDFVSQSAKDNKQK